MKAIQEQQQSISARIHQRGMVRVYDKRGPVRLEFQLRDRRAHLIALDVFSRDYRDWEITAKGHLRQYVDFANREWWRLFVNMVERKDLYITSARAVSFQRMEGWINKQVSVALSVWFDVQGESAKAAFEQILERARRRNRVKYTAVLELAEQELHSPEGAEAEEQ